MGDRFGRARMLLLALTLFALGSAAGGAAPSLWLLIGARILQGVGGGGLMVMSQALIGELLPPRERPRFQGYFAGIFALASVAGPVIGGFVVEHASWRWLLLVNLPLCALAAWRVHKLPGERPHARAVPFEDGRGVLLFASATVLTLLWLNFAGHRFAWLSTPSVGLSAAAAALWWLLLRRERALANPFLPIELSRVPGIGTIAGTVTLFASCFFAFVFFLPIYF